MTTEAKKLLAALWRDQTARHPEPPTPALVDAYYELELPLAPWLHWCRENRVVPVKQTEDAHTIRCYNWYAVLARSHKSLWGAMWRALNTPPHRNVYWWHRTLRGAYEKLLIVPLEAFR